MSGCMGLIYYVTIALVIFSYVKISCFPVKAHLVFHQKYHMKETSIYDPMKRGEIGGGRGV